MTVYAWISTREWNWKPSWDRYGWPLKKGGRVWYLRFSWLCFGINADNEE